MYFNRKVIECPWRDHPGNQGTHGSEAKYEPDGKEQVDAGPGTHGGDQRTQSTHGLAHSPHTLTAVTGRKPAAWRKRKAGGGAVDMIIMDTLRAN